MLSPARDDHQDPDPARPRTDLVLPETTAGPVWLDEGAVDPTWSVPATRPRRRSLPQEVAWGLIAAALVAVLVLVRALGGFERRADLLRPTATGTLISTGRYELRSTGATAQQRTR